jgi:glutamyl-tRNA reductase
MSQEPDVSPEPNLNGISGHEPELTGTTYVCGINHERAELSIRERFALGPERCVETLRRLRESGLAEEALVLSTCNRTEIYIIAPLHELLGRRLREFFLSLAGRDAHHHSVPLYNYDGLEATRHYFAVNAGLNSMILGENEIKSQARSAFEMSRREGMAGPNLHRLVKWANRCSKRIRTETDLNSGTLSFGKASVLRAEEVLGSLDSKVCVVIGAGKVGRVAAEAIHERRPAQLVIVNRTLDRAAEIARGLAADVAQIGEIPALMQEADLVIGAAFAPNFLVTRGMFEAARGPATDDRRVCLVDAAVPRILDQAIGELPGVTLLDVGDLESIIAINRDRRIAAAQHAWEIVEEEMEKFHGRMKATHLGPVITRLRDRFDDIFSETMGPLEAGHPEDARSRYQELQHRLKQRLLHEAIGEIKRLHKDLG